VQKGLLLCTTRLPRLRQLGFRGFFKKGNLMKEVGD
jgi:hypothetical protein